MKRSEINQQIKWAIHSCKTLGYFLPSFAYWTPEDWLKYSDDTEHLTSTMMGWDVTDYNSGNFDKIGAVLFTLRNGNIYDSSKGTPYCEKMIALKAGQILPLHYHVSKTEDIINRAGGTLCVRLYNSIVKDGTYHIDELSDVKVRMDGIMVQVPAGGVVEVTNGNSITLTPYIYHEFYAKPEDGDLIVGEVSTINDDRKDNFFATPVVLPPIEEDEVPLYPLCNGYQQ